MRRSMSLFGPSPTCCNVHYLSALEVNVLQNPGAFYGSTGFEHC